MCDVSRWCGCDGHLLSGGHLYCITVCPRGCWPPTTHPMSPPATKHGLGTKHFSGAIDQPLSASIWWRYWTLLASGQIPSINLKLIETLKMLWNQILMWDGLFYLLTVGFIRSDKVSKYHMAPRVSCLLSVSRDPSFYNNIFLSSDDLFSWNK